MCSSHTSTQTHQAKRVEEALQFMQACGMSADSGIMSETEFYTSHECLLLDYEEALTRLDSTTNQWCVVVDGWVVEGWVGAWCAVAAAQRWEHGDAAFAAGLLQGGSNTTTAARCTRLVTSPLLLRLLPADCVCVAAAAWGAAFLLVFFFCARVASAGTTALRTSCGVVSAPGSSTQLTWSLCAASKTPSVSRCV